MKNDWKKLEAMLGQEAVQRGLPATQESRFAILQEWINNSAADPMIRLLNEVEVAETQREVADILATNRDLLSGLSRERRDYALSVIDERAEELPEV